MTEQRIKFNNIVQNQLPSYVREEFPLISEFLKQYYISQEFQGAPVDLIQNIDSYIKLDETASITESVILQSNIDEFAEVISVDLTQSPSGTNGFPDSYGLLKINNEIITYTGKTSSSFTGCIRGFSGISSYREDSNPDALVFDSTISSTHTSGSTIENLSVLFLKEFLVKLKHQFLPGLDERDLSGDLNQNIFIKQAKDFYSSRGTDRSFEILFKSLYNEEVKIVRPRDFLFTPSNGEYRITNDFVVESLEGDPIDLENDTLYQDQYESAISNAYAPITRVEKIVSGIGQTYYKLSIDAGYDRDIDVDGSIYGNFSIHSNTRVIGNVSLGSTVVDVDSTIGFPSSGEIYVSYEDSTIGIVSYTSKSLNQFYGCSNISKNILDTSEVGINTYARNYDGNIKVRIKSVINSFDFPSDTFYYSANDTAQIKTLGSNLSGFKSKNWILNICPIFEVKSLSVLDNTDKTYRVILTKDHPFRIGDSAEIIDNNNVSKTTKIIDITSSDSFVIKGQGDLNLVLSYKIKKTLQRAVSNNFPYISAYTTNVQNIYNDSGKILVAASSLPFYDGQPLDTTDRSIVFSGTFVGSDFQVTSVKDHGFYTGDSIYYIPEKITEQYYENNELKSRTVINTFLLDEGLYFVKRVNPTTIKLSRSRTDLYNQRYVSLDNPTSVVNNILQPYNFRFKLVNNQKILREISNPINDGYFYETTPGFTGILINGVEIRNYKSSDVVYYGRIEGVEVISPGSNYDVINPPLLNISDEVGVGATGYVAISGSLNSVRIINPGFDYIETPIIQISGGNGTGAVALPNMKLINHSIFFNSEDTSTNSGVSTASNTIGFGTYHKFRNAEAVSYNTFSQTSVGGISTDSIYYVSVQNEYTIKLHKTLDDAVSGINTINLTSTGIGRHSFKSINKKSVLESVSVVSSGSGYQNKKRTVESSGIGTSNNIVTIPGHDYSSGEIIRYTSGDSSIAGLSSGTDYFVTRIDSDRFRLSQVGVGTTNRDFYYNTRQYINFQSTGVGTHSFNYQPITVSVVGKIGISSVGSETFGATVQPIFRGQVTSIHLSNKGVGYGSSEVINLNRQPDINLVSGQDAQLLPIVSGGRIVEVIVLNYGQKYNSPPDLVINGPGVGAVITPVLDDGIITSVNVLEGGVGYSQQDISISVIFPGSSAEFSAKIQRWNVNLFGKNFSTFTGDDGYIAEGLNEKYQLQYSHIYAPRKLREIVYSVDQTGKTLFGQKDLTRINNLEVSSNNHSPIIGWAYDGNPIYGPYGYITRSGGTITQLKSGYKLDLKSNRPSVLNFPEGFFVEDYTYYDVSDETVLDENNGRFCVTPEYPNGTYAYFATFETLLDSSGPFSGYKRPSFPYLIGNSFNSAPNSFNFTYESNQDDIDLNETKWSRNTSSYNLMDGSVVYEYVSIPNDLKQTLDVKSVVPGNVENIGINTGGNNYAVNDTIVFDNEGTNGSGVVSKISRVGGKDVNNVSVATSTISNVEIYPSDNKGNYLVICGDPHGFKNRDFVTVFGLSTTSSKIEGFYSIGVTTNTLSVAGLGTLSSGIGSVSSTGLVTYFKVSGSLGLNQIRENDILNIEQEKVKVLNVDSDFSRIRVLRSIDGTVGVSHSVTTVLYENPRKLTINSGFRTTFDYKQNKEIYFDPSESVGLGTGYGIGIGYTITLSNPGSGITQIFIPTKSIYIKNHGLSTGDELTYSPNSGSGLIVIENGVGIATTLSDQQKIFVARITNDLIGLSTVRVALGSTGTFVGIASTVSNSTLMAFTGVGTGVYHSFKTNYESITGSISRNLVTVSTAQTHGLQNNQNVFVDVNPSISTSYTITYNDYNRKLLINPKSFISSGINTLSNSITIQNHGFKTGDKVVHTSSSPSQGLVNNQIYFAIKIDDDTFKLSDSYYESVGLKPTAVGITSASNGTISKVNPPIEVYGNSSLVFDLSDSSLSYTNQSTLYPAFELNFYLDETYRNLYYKDNNNTNSFNVQRIGRVGIDTTSKVILSITDNTPQKLFYRLDPVFESTLPLTKEEIDVDDTVISNNQILIKQSLFNGKQTISISTESSFTYTIPQTPEKSSYTSSEALLTYETDSTTAYGPISKVEIVDRGRNYYSIPGITTVVSNFGSGAILEPSSKSIGKILRTKINDIGFDFPSDGTLRPSVSLPQIMKVEPLSSFESIGVTSFGRGYNSAPRLLVFDGKTNEIVEDVDLKYELGNSRIEILKNTYGINNTTPTILPIQNSNGVGIASVGFSTITKDVTITLSVGFSTADSFPFQVNDRVLIENVSVGIGSTFKGYNSSAYDYQLFTLTAVDENRGGIGSVTYNLSEYLDFEENPGTFDPLNSSGRIIPEKYFPTFSVSLTKNDFIDGENVKSGSSSGVVESWNKTTGILKVSSNTDFRVNEIIVGETSNTQGIASSITSFESSFVLDTFSKVTNGWNSNSGFLNDSLQRVQDSFYYQNFSYSIKSRVSFQTWDDAVSSLNHTVGFKKFSDLQLESELTDSNKNSMVVGISTDLTSFEVIGDLTGVVNLNCVYDFDLVTENSLTQGSSFLSDEIIFSSRILTDYFESFGNRVLSIDDLSGLFNSNPRGTAFSIVNTFKLSDVRAQKYFVYVRDLRFTAQRQLMAVTLVHDGTFAYINQYGRTETVYDLGSFDFSISGSDGELTFYPTRFTINDYQLSLISYNLDDNLLSVGSTSIGGIVDIKTSSNYTAGAASTSIVSIGTTYRSVKALVEISGPSNEYEFDELNIIHDGTEVYFIEYGQITTNAGIFGISGFGTYNPYISGSNLIVDFVPNPGVAVTLNTIQVAITTEGTSGIGTVDLKHARIEARSTTISSSGSPGIHTIGSYPDEYDSAYFIVQVSDTTNNRYQISEVIVVDDYVDETSSYDTYDTEFGVIETVSGLGTIGSRIIGSSSGIGTVELLFTPIAGIDATVNVYMNSLRIQDDSRDEINFNNATIRTGFGNYEGTERSIRRSFELEHKNDPIFVKEFVGSSSTIVNTSSNTIRLPNHFFVTGENVRYVHAGAGTTMAIGIGTTTFVGVGSTDKLPEEIYIVKVNDDTVKLASTAENALKIVPETLDITSVGIGTSHRFIAKNQNSKVLIALDNIIQSPVVSTAVTTTLAKQAFTTDDLLLFTGITSFFGSDLIRIGSEIMKIEGVGIGSTNTIRVRRNWLGTPLVGHSTGSLVTKVNGNYNIVENTLNFTEAPYGNTPLGTSTNPPDERDWTGISVSSRFQGRTFLRSGITNTINETYYKNYIFDDISAEFNGDSRDFILRSNGSGVTGIATEGAIILINDVFQSPGLSYDYTMSEDVGITTLSFTGTATSLSSDPNTTNLPLGGVIVSVGSSEGFGYQPLVSAGGTAIVSIAGTIGSISIGNSGSGYRSGIQTNVRVAVQTSSTGTPNLHYVGIASISNGHIVSVAITNPGSGYTSTNPPTVVFDSPLSYDNIPLIYSSTSSGFGTGAAINVVVGQGSSVIDFEITNTGRAYGQEEVLTVPIGGLVGIPTDPSKPFREFQITIQNTFTDEFTGWSFGTLDILDSIENLFDGETVTFALKSAGNLVSIRSGRGSKINVQDVLLVFVNDILQVPGEGYTFTGGSIITFTEPPKVGDRCRIIFYKGSGDSDVVFRNVIETVKIGDELTIGYDYDRGQQPTLQEDARTVTSVDATDIISTIPYFGPGNTEDETLLRPVVWCRQTEDRIINEKEIGKDRELYEPVINPVAYIIKSVGIGSTEIYVDSVRPFFNPQNENDFSLQFQKKIRLISQDERVSAAATAIVSIAGTISSIIISDSGVGYSTDPSVSIGSTLQSVGLGTTATAVATIGVGGTVSLISITNSGTGYTSTNPPLILISPPTLIEEDNTVDTYSGDSGVIVGFGITTISSIDQVIFDFYIPTISYLRDTSVVGTAITVSGIGTGDYFLIYNSNVGLATTSITSIDTSNNVIGIGTNFVDNVYQVESVSNVSVANTTIGIATVGTATTTVRRIYARISSGISTINFSSTNITFDSTVFTFDSTGIGSGSGYSGGITTSNYFGNFSWGKIQLSARTEENEFNFYGNVGVGGISTSAYVIRTEPLKYLNYI
jgi:hypothetical protein